MKKVALLFLAPLVLGTAETDQLKIVAVKDSGVVTINSSGVTSISSDHAKKYQVVWSPDGSRIAIASAVDEMIGKAKVTIVKDTGEQVSQFLIQSARDNTPPSAMREIEELHWLTNSRVVAGGSVNPDAALYEVHDVTTGKLIRIFESAAGEPGFSPDGNHVAFVAGRSHFDQNGIYDLVIDDEHHAVFSTSLASDQPLTTPKWAADGQSVSVLFGPSTFATARQIIGPDQLQRTLVVWGQHAGLRQAKLPASVAHSFIEWSGKDVIVRDQVKLASADLQGSTRAQGFVLRAGATLVEPIAASVSHVSAENYRKSLDAKVETLGATLPNYWCLHCALSDQRGMSPQQ